MFIGLLLCSGALNAFYVFADFEGMRYVPFISGLLIGGNTIFIPVRALKHALDNTICYSIQRCQHSVGSSHQQVLRYATLWTKLWTRDSSSGNWQLDIHLHCWGSVRSGGVNIAKRKKLQFTIPIADTGVQNRRTAIISVMDLNASGIHSL